MIFGIILIIGFVIIDFVTKRLASFYLKSPLKNIVVIKELFELSYYENKGASLGIFEGQMIFFMIVTVVALAIFIYLFLSVDFKNKKAYSVAITLFIAGTIGNAIDRLLLGYVIDFMHFPFLSYILDIFKLSNFYNNMADMYLTVAVILFAIDLIFSNKKVHHEKN